MGVFLGGCAEPPSTVAAQNPVHLLLKLLTRSAQTDAPFLSWNPYATLLTPFTEQLMFAETIVIVEPF